MDTVEIVHIHNYSMCAIHSLICEIKKFPIIYKDNKGICFASELIDLAWSRIISAVLDCGGAFIATDREYWGLSFRELWKWMRFMLIKDMKARTGNHMYIRSSKYNWLDCLKFVEKHICLLDETSETAECHPNVQVQLISAGSEATADVGTSTYTVTWLIGSNESASAGVEGISIRLRSILNTSKEGTRKQPSSDLLLYADSNTFDDSFSVSIPSPSLSFFVGSPSPAFSVKCQGTPSEDDTVLPQQEHIQELIDEDFEFSMSLLPKLKKLDPKRNTEVKMLILQALHDAF